MNECYICLEFTDQNSPCKCIGLHLCENCLLKLKLYNYKECTLCRDVFPIHEDEIIDIELFVNGLDPPSDCTCKPICCRRGAARRDPKYCGLDTLINACGVISLTFFICFLRGGCDDKGILGSFVFSIVVYTAFASLLVLYTNRNNQ